MKTRSLELMKQWNFNSTFVSWITPIKQKLEKKTELSDLTESKWGCKRNIHLAGKRSWLWLVEIQGIWRLPPGNQQTAARQKIKTKPPPFPHNILRVTHLPAWLGALHSVPPKPTIWHQEQLPPSLLTSRMKYYMTQIMMAELAPELRSDFRANIHCITGAGSHF